MWKLAMAVALGGEERVGATRSKNPPPKESTRPEQAKWEQRGSGGQRTGRGCDGRKRVLVACAVRPNPQLDTVLLPYA